MLLRCVPPFLGIVISGANKRPIILSRKGRHQQFRFNYEEKPTRQFRACRPRRPVSASSATIGGLSHRRGRRAVRCNFPCRASAGSATGQGKISAAIPHAGIACISRDFFLTFLIYVRSGVWATEWAENSKPLVLPSYLFLLTLFPPRMEGAWWRRRRHGSEAYPRTAGTGGQKNKSLHSGLLKPKPPTTLKSAGIPFGL